MMTKLIIKMKLFTNLDHEVISLDLYIFGNAIITSWHIARLHLTTLFDGLRKGTSPTGVHSSFGFDFCSWYVE
jgi:hypothetical protein